MSAADEVTHTSFTLVRNLPARPQHAFRFWAEPELKNRWNDCHPDWKVVADELDFRVGGNENRIWRLPDGKEQTLFACYLDIVPSERIVYAYEMGFAGRRLSASLVTITFATADVGTRMTFTEQVALLSGDAGEGREREIGTGEGFDRLVEEISRSV